ncbi:MAG TPA: signal peptidase I [Polyangia bacterium]|nr:signal peptidase I [Polyangia bacterium]
MAAEPPNPYAPTDALAHKPAPEANAQAAPAGEPSRFWAFVVAIFAQPIAGAGFYLLRRPRRFVGWTAVGLLVRALLIVAARAALAKLCVIAIALMLLTGLASIADTAIAKPRGVALKHGWLVGLLFIFASVGSSLCTRIWLVEAFQIPAGSMIPALLVGDHIFVKKGPARVERGDVIVFKFPMDPSTDYVKRVVAIGGDTIEVRNGVPVINGVPLEHQPLEQPCSYRDDASPIPDEPAEPCKLVRETNAGRTYTIMLQPDRPAIDHPRTVVPPNGLFMLGDNRDNSYDSRRWGTVDTDLVKGKATVIWYSRGASKTGIRWSRIGRGVE